LIEAQFYQNLFDGSPVLSKSRVIHRFFKNHNAVFKYRKIKGYRIRTKNGNRKEKRAYKKLLPDKTTVLAEIVCKMYARL